MAITTHLNTRHRGLVPDDQIATGTASAGRVPVSDGSGSRAWTTPTGLTVKEEDGTPTVANVTEIKVTSGSLTDNGSGSVSIDTSGGVGGSGGWHTESTDGVALDTGRTKIYGPGGSAGSMIRIADPDIFIVPDTGGSLYLDGPGHVVAEFGLGIVLPLNTSDPTAYSDGELFYNDSTDILRLRANGAWKNVPVRKGSGTATVTSGNTSIAVTHSAGYTPSASDISVVPTNNPTNDPGWFWISSIGATQFTINVRADPGASGATFAWAVDH